MDNKILSNLSRFFIYYLSTLLENETEGPDFQIESRRDSYRNDLTIILDELETEIPEFDGRLMETLRNRILDDTIF